MEDVDVTELNRMVCDALECHAATGKLPRENDHGIEVLVNTKGTGVIRYRFVTWDDLQIEADFSVPSLMAEGRDYIDHFLLNVAKRIEDRRHADARGVFKHILSPK